MAFLKCRLILQSRIISALSFDEKVAELMTKYTTKMKKLSAKIIDMDMTKGPLLKNLIAVALPLALSGVLQLLFNAADLMVIGQFSKTGTQSLAAVSSNTALINLLVNVAIGISVGVNVIMAQAIGAADEKRAVATLHTSMCISVVLGLALGIIGVSMAKVFLVWMDTDPVILDKAVLYLRLYFIGAPANIIYNFGTAALRAKGDTARPLLYLFLAGVLNVCLNLIFVIVASLDVAGVAIATVVSQYVSCILLIATMLKEKGYCKLSIKKLKFYKGSTSAVLKVGLPSGILSSFFSVANVLIQTNLNGFGYALVAGSSTSSNLEGFVYTSMNAVSNASVSFAGQNYGARKFDRIKKIAFECSAMVIVISLFFSAILLTAGKYVAMLYVTDEVVIDYAVQRLTIILPIYFVCGIVEILVGCLRGMGYSLTPTLTSFFCVCIFRIIWIYTACQAIHTPEMLYLSWPISWVINFVIDVIIFIFLFNKEKTASQEYAPKAGKVVAEFSSYEEMKKVVVTNGLNGDKCGEKGNACNG